MLHGHEAPASQAPAPHKGRGLSVRSLRPMLSVVLVVGVVAFTVGILILIQRIFANFGPGVQADLEWKAVRGAQELAQTTKLGIVTSDNKIIEDAFGGYRQSADVVALVAQGTGGDFQFVWGKPPEPVPQLFAGSPGQIRRTHDYYLSWSNSEIEGTVVGKVAVVISTFRLVNSQKLLGQITTGTVIAAGLTLVAGLAFILLFTGAIIKRDAQLADYAATLENKVAQRTAELAARNQEMRLVLDNVDQGFITIDLASTMAAERSAIVDRWLGESPANASLIDYLAKVNQNFADYLRMGLAEVQEDILPLELLLEQLPKKFTLGDTTLHFGYIPLVEKESVRGLLVVISDITEQLARERMEREQRQLVHIFQSIAADRAGFLDFFQEAESLVARIARAEDENPTTQKRLVHTLKGNSGLYHLDQLAQICHDVESRLAEEGNGISPAEKAHILEAWRQVVETSRKLLGETEHQVLVEDRDYGALIGLVEKRASHDVLKAALASWKMEFVSVRFERFAEQARQLASRLGKGAINVVIKTPRIRLDPRRWSPFWSAFVHVVRNAVDHGLELTEARVAAGKSTKGTLRLHAKVEGDALIVRLEDDGAGVDWQRLAEKAKQQGLPHSTQKELEAALFADGVSTRTEITLVSGRGVGMSAVKDATLYLGGRIHVESTPGQGTAFEFRFPEAGFYLPGEVDSGPG